MRKPVVAAGMLAAALCCAATADAQETVVDTNEKTGVLAVTIELRGTEVAQPYSPVLEGQPLKNAKGEPVTANHIEAADYYRRIDLEIPLFGYLGGASGFHDIDTRESEKVMATHGQAAGVGDSSPQPHFDQQALEGLHAAIAACGDNAGCLADATRTLAAAAQAQETAASEPATVPKLPNLQRYLALASRPGEAGEACGTATFKVDDHHIGRSVDSTAGWMTFDYHRQGLQSVPPSAAAASANDAWSFVDTSPSLVTMCGVKVALDLDEKIYHLDLGGLSPTLRTVRADFPDLSPRPVALMGDGPTKLLFLDQAGSGNSISVEPFEIKGFSYLTGTQGQTFPLDATISWTIKVNGALPE